MKGSESVLFTNVLLSFTVKHFVSREEILSKTLISGSSSGFTLENWFTVNGLKDILKFWFNSNLNYKFRLTLKDRC